MLIRAFFCLTALLWSLTAQGQQNPTSRQPANGSIPPATVPAQRVPNAQAGKPTKPVSTTNPASKLPEESDLERELNQRYSQPGRLGPTPARPGVLSPKPTRPIAQDTTQSGQPVTAGKTQPTDSVQVSEPSISRTSTIVALPLRARTAYLIGQVRFRSLSPSLVRPQPVINFIPTQPTVDPDSVRIATGNPPTDSVQTPVQPVLRTSDIVATALRPKNARLGQLQPRVLSLSLVRPQPAIRVPRPILRPDSVRVAVAPPTRTTPARPNPVVNRDPVKSDPVRPNPAQTKPPVKTPVVTRAPSATATAPRSSTTSVAQTAKPATGAQPGRSESPVRRSDTSPGAVVSPGVVSPGVVSPNVVIPESRTAVAQLPNRPAPNRRDSVQVAANEPASAKRDSVQTEDQFKTTVNYQSKDSTIYAADGQTVELFGEASVVYGEISLSADYIRLNYLTNEVYAKGRFDSTAQKLIGRPVFQDGESKYDAKEIRYNFKSKKGKIQGVITQQGEGNIRGQTVKKDNEDNLYIGRAIYTTCNLATPHFHINASKLKVIHNKQVVAGPFNLVINQIPLPIGLPFGFFPFPKRKEIGVSGILVPQYGDEPNGRGYYLRDGGYYWAVNENIGLQFKGQIYSRGSWGVGVSSAYNKRYRYSGGVNLQFNRNRSSDRVDLNQQAPRNDFSVAWSHAPVPRGRGSFSANVNVSSNSYNQLNAYNTQQYISNVAGSSVQYSRTFGQYLRAGANVRVNQQFGQINQTTGRRENGKTDVSTDFNLGLNQISPFALRGGSGRWYESFRVGLDISGSLGINNTIRSQVDTTGLGFPVITNLRPISRVNQIIDSTNRANALRRNEVLPDPNLIGFNPANLNRIWENRVVQARYSIPISLPNVKLLRYINLTPGFSLQGDIYSKRLDYVYVESRDSVRIDTARGFFPSYNFSVNASLNTRFYGTYFIRGKRIEAIRHTVAPSISFSYIPDFTNPAFGQFEVLPRMETGNLAPLRDLEYRRTLSRFRGLGGSSGGGGSTESAFISFGIVNQLEMKIRTRSDSAGQDFKKVPIFDNLSLTGSYNFLAPDYKLSPIAVSANTQIFKNISFNFSSTFDPYAYRAYGGTPIYDLSTYASGATPTPLSYSPLILQTVGYENQEFVRRPNVYAINAGQGLLRMTNLQAYVSARFAPKQADKPKTSPNATDATLKAINNNPELYVDFTIPWSVNMSYTFGLTRITPERSQVVQALTLTGDLSLTPKWKITVNTGYDFVFKSPTLTTIGINRDLHCWEMAFNWTPYAGSNIRSGNYSFDLRARSSILQELKLSRRRSFNDYGGLYGR